MWILGWSGDEVTRVDVYKGFGVFLGIVLNFMFLRDYSIVLFLSEYCLFLGFVLGVCLGLVLNRISFLKFYRKRIEIILIYKYLYYVIINLYYKGLSEWFVNCVDGESVRIIFI